MLKRRGIEAGNPDDERGSKVAYAVKSINFSDVGIWMANYLNVKISAAEDMKIR